MTPAAAIRLDEVTVRYSRQAPPVFTDLSLAVAVGSFVTILGPSGCGKSTLLAAMAGFTNPEKGEVRFDGAPVTGPGKERGVVFQRDVLFPWATVERNLGFALRANGTPRRDRRELVRALLDSVGLSPAVTRKLPHELSGGMRQRVGIARALANSPQVVLMDEPFGALDAQTRSQMQDLVSNLWEQTGATVVFVTHDVDEAIRLATTLVVMGLDGSIVEQLANPLPMPRSASRLAEFPEYAPLRRRLHELLCSPRSVHPHQET